MENDLTLQKLCSRLMKLLHTPVRIYGRDKKRIAVYGIRKEQPDILASDPGFEEMLLDHVNTVAPLYIYAELEDVLYAVIYGESLEKSIIIGPYCFHGEPVYVAEKLKHIHGMDQETEYKLIKGEKEVFDQSILLLYDMISEKSLEIEQVYAQCSNISSFSDEIAHHAVQIAYSYREEEQLHNPYSQELREQEAIRTGDIVLLKESRAEGYTGKLGTLSSNPLRSRKNLGISVIAISVRSAIAGGVNPERALTFSDAAIQKLELVKSIPEVDAVTVDAQLYLTRMVHETKQENKNHVKSPLVDEAKQLIVKYLHGKVSISLLAKELKVSQSGLYKAFLKEENMTLSNYILKEKVEASKELLRYSEDTYGEIAACYGFSSQSHFGQTFKRITGMTPGEYRKEYSKKRSGKR